ncbi:MAG: hypothetical protein IT379_01695 [Deltaproteobacteria bacterium]|nr:hypothetical protein [Deltaproteobacteria bacterium]
MRWAMGLCVGSVFGGILGCGAGKTAGPEMHEAVDAGPNGPAAPPPSALPPGTPARPGGDPDDPGPEPDLPEPWSLDVDMSATNRFVEGNPPSWPIQGRAIASLGLDRVEVGGTAASTMPDGSFRADVAVARGLSLVTVDAFDRAAPEHRRKAHRSLLAARFLPEGAINRDAAALTLTDAMLESMAAPLAGEVAAIDVASEIMARGTLSSSMGCVTWPAFASHDSPQLELFQDGRHDLWLRVMIPNLYVAFTGECSLLLSSAPIEGEIITHVDIYTRLTPKASDGCVPGFDHTSPYVELPGFDVDVRGTGLLTGFLVSLAASMREGSTQEEFRAQFASQADSLLGERVSTIRVFDRTSTMNMLGRDVQLGLCLTDLRTEGESLRATIGATASGSGTITAPGAPQVEGTLPPASANTLWLDANLVSQLLFSSWRAGGLSNGALMELPISTLALLNRSLRTRFPEGTMVTVAIAAELPPYVQASSTDTGDLALDIGDLMIEMKVGEEVLYRVGTVIHALLDLVPEGGGLRPTVVELSSQVHVVAEPAGDVPDDVLETVVSTRVGEAASMLLGGTSLSLPEIPGAGRPIAVSPVPGGRYLAITLE